MRFPRLSVSLALGGTVLMLLGCLDPLEGVFLIVPGGIAAIVAVVLAVLGIGRLVPAVLSYGPPRATPPDSCASGGHEMRSPDGSSFASVCITGLLIVGALAVLLLATSCHAGDSILLGPYLFPPGSHWEGSGDWTHEMWIDASTDARMVRRSEKDVRITIRDRNKKPLLDDNLKVTCADVEAKVTWKEFEQVDVELLEFGNRFATDDPYNVALVKSGPRSLIKLEYLYDRIEKRFKRIK